MLLVSETGKAESKKAFCDVYLFKPNEENVPQSGDGGPKSQTASEQIEIPAFFSSVVCFYKAIGWGGGHNQSL